MDLINNWREEKRSAYLYHVIAENEHDVSYKKLFLELKSAADKQALLWEEKINSQQLQKPLPFKPDFRTYLVCYLIKKLGIKRLRFMLSAMKIRGMSIFAHYNIEQKHTMFNTANNVRAAIFGINDGLISNMSLILGIAGANSSYHTIILTGVAGLLAGACSMGAGEYISVRSQREIFEYQIAIEKQELEEYPEEEIKELTLIYQARGIPADEAKKLATIIINNPETGLNTLVREELGINPEDMVSPTGAMIASFISFAIGAFIPLVPFLFGDRSGSLIASSVITAMTLFMIGAILSLLTNRHPLLLGVRMLLIGSAAGGLTFVIGKILGIAML
jgi:VIT1/CCC1 family predicted Fe2+/Mn2+ transporter